MTELLAPAGSMEALKAAISNGCDAIYLGMQKFGARAYSSNFDLDSLKEAINYAHLRDVKIYVTMNTIMFESEMEEMKTQMDQLNQIGVDGIIVQDLAALDYVVKHFVDMEAHCSTQMGLDDLEGTLLLKEMGAKRVVLSRELSIDQIKEIRKQANLPVEVFVHGALCVSYSGNCLMSGLIGYRSGNRGRCVGSCRKEYELIDTVTGENLGKSYLLSTKDLSTIDHIDALRGLDSLKIEGRMKEPAYVANVVSTYRKALDGQIEEQDKENLQKTFNRTYTKGYIFHEPKKDITNTHRPNNAGFEVGHISRVFRDKYEISLFKPLHQNDIVRISHGAEDVNFTLVKLYDQEGMLINKADQTCYIKIKEKLSVGDKVYISKDHLHYKALEATLDQEFRRYDLNLKVYGYPGAKLMVEADAFGLHYQYESEEILEEANNRPTSRDQVIKQVSRLNETIFQLGQVDYEEANAFIPAKMLNDARRTIVEALVDLKLNRQQKRVQEAKEEEKLGFPLKTPYLTATVTNQDQYEACLAMGLTEVYYKNIVRRNQNNYQDLSGQLLIGGYGGIYRYKETNPFVTDFSLNVVNASSCYQLHQLGAKRVTLSYEINKAQIEDLIEAYYEKNNGYPTLEMIVYGKAPLLFTKYCPLEKMGQCGQCKAKTYELHDEHGSFPVQVHEDCAITLLNGKTLNLLDELSSIDKVEAFRLNFTTESKEEVAAIIHKAKGKLAGSLEASVFNQETDTRGHFHKEIM